MFFYCRIIAISWELLDIICYVAAAIIATALLCGIFTPYLTVCCSRAVIFYKHFSILDSAPLGNMTSACNQKKKSSTPGPPAAILKGVKGRLCKALREEEPSCNGGLLPNSDGVQVNDGNIQDVFFPQCRHFRLITAEEFQRFWVAQVYFVKRSTFDFTVTLASPPSALECHADLHMTRLCVSHRARGECQGFTAWASFVLFIKIFVLPRTARDVGMEREGRTDLETMIQSDVTGDVWAEVTRKFRQEDWRSRGTMRRTAFIMNMQNCWCPSCACDGVS